MKHIDLKLERRSETGGGSSGRLRNQGLIPAIIYGSGMEAAPARVKATELRKFLKHNGRSTVFNTEFAEEHDLTVLIKDIQINPVNHEIVHLDLQKVREDERVQVQIPIRVIGTESVRRAGGVVLHQKDSVAVECLPGDIPQHADADLTDFTPGHSFTAGDLKFTPQISMLSKPGEVLLTVVGHEQEIPPEAEAEL